MFADRVLYARKGEDVTSQAVTLGGDKITVDDAIVSRYSDYFLCLINPLADSEEGLLGRAQHCPHPSLDQDWRHLPRPGADQRVRAQGSQGGYQGVPAHSRKGLNFLHATRKF